MSWREKIMEGVEIADRGNTEAAFKYFKEALEQNPENVTALLCVSVAAFETSQYEEALHYVDRALSLNPTETHANQTKGRILAAMSKYEEAIRYYDIEIELNPDDSYTYVYKGEAFYGLAKIESALDCYEVAISKDSGNAITYEKMAVTHQVLAAEHLKKAETAWREVLELDPLHTAANNYLCDVLEQLGKYDEAKQYRVRTRRLMDGHRPDPQ